MNTDRFAHARRRHRRRRIFIAGGVALAVIAAGALGWIIWFSSWLTVEDVEVDGLSSIKSDTVIEKADVPNDVPLARIDTDSIAERVSDISRVERADVSRGWPHTIRIEVHERTPVAWTESGDEVRAVDRHGVEYRTLSEEPDDLVELDVPDEGEGRSEALRAGASVVHSLRQRDRDFLKKVTVVSAETRDSVELEVGEDSRVRWGSPGETREKLRALRVLIDNVDAGQYDVSAPERPTTEK